MSDSESMPAPEEIERELGFRRPLSVTQIVYFIRFKIAYPCCPRCHATLEREYMLFCDRCGQRLDWSTLPSALVKTIK